ncbi:LamG domain-containing protein [Paenibacillus sp. SCIV0701]|uniref:LamG domain-containing protein n=2 Tax=Paenibacillus soyae TaxID=2969249 RepID=A0A9X2S8N3_9BACL|nr:LamG domain-containing protein [Paenibacillus soyae]
MTYADAENGVQGQAAIFDGASGVVLPSGLIKTRDYSISLWMKPSELNRHTTAFFGARTDANWISLLPRGNEEVPVDLTLWSNNGGNWYNARTAVATSIDTWTHVALTVHNGELKLYVNGEEKYSGTDFPDLFTTSNGTFSLGVNYWDTPFKGMLDELRVYEGVLTAAEVEELAAQETQE